MDAETFKHFKYEMALGAAIPMPEPKIDYYPHSQFSVQQFLYTLCKKHVGSLGKRGGEWEFGKNAPPNARLSARADITQLLDYAEELRIIEPVPPDEIPSTQGETFVPYRLSKLYWDRFDKFQL